LGSCISRGTISEDDGFFAAEARDANVFDRGRNGEEEWEGDAVAAGLLDALEKAGCDGESVAEPSDAVECDREDIGTIKLCRL
jgi:hypothetical protein